MFGIIDVTKPKVKLRVRYKYICSLTSDVYCIVDKKNKFGLYNISQNRVTVYPRFEKMKKNLENDRINSS